MSNQENDDNANDRRSFVVSTLALLGAALFGLPACERRQEPSSQAAAQVVLPRPAPLPALDWSLFLRKWSDEVLALIQSDALLHTTPIRKEAIQAGYLGYAAAAEQEIAATEKRLGLPLPPSYKNFLRASNGWRQIAMDAEDGRLHPVSRIGWFRDLQPQSLRGWLSGTGNMDATDAQYFVYGEKQDSVNLRDSYVKEALAISTEIDSAIYLLNPKVVDSNGEWEAWYFGYKLPGANRYRSFQEMMEAEYQNTLRNLKNEIVFFRNLKK